MKKNFSWLRKIFAMVLLAALTLSATPSYAASSPFYVHLHNEPGVTRASKSVYASSDSTNPKLIKVTVDGQMQSGDVGYIYYQTYNQCVNGGYISYETFNSVPFTANCPIDTFGAYIKVTAGSGNTGCTIVYISSATNSYNNTSSWGPVYCDIEDPPPVSPDPPDPIDPVDPPDPPEPPSLPSAPTIPGAPTYTIENPSLPSGSISIPGPGEFDGSYVYEEPEREGPYTYTPPPLDIPEPIPSPPPPPQGPGLFDFSEIMQDIGAPDEPITPQTPISGDGPLSPDNPMGGNSPIPQNPPGTGEAPKTVEQPGAIDNANVSAPISVTPAKQPEVPKPVQPAVIDPVVMEPVLNRETPLQPQIPLSQD